MSFAESRNLQPGDVVICPKSDFNIVGHYVIYGGRNYFGNHIYFENIRGYGVRVITESQFVYENPRFSRIRRLNGNYYHRSLAIERAKSQLGRAYVLFGFNCEDYANYVQYGKAYSGQTARAGAAVGTFFFLLLLGI